MAGKDHEAMSAGTLEDNIVSVMKTLQTVVEAVGQAIQWVAESGIGKWLLIIAACENPTIGMVKSICESNQADGECPFRDECFANESTPLQALLLQHRAGCAWIVLRNAAVLLRIPREGEVLAMTLLSKELIDYVYSQVDQREKGVLKRLETKWQNDRPPLIDQYARYINGLIGESEAIFNKLDGQYQEYILNTAGDYLFNLAEYSRFFAIWQEHGDEQLWIELINWYVANDQVSRFLKVLQGSPLSSYRKRIIRDAVEAHQQELYTLSVPVLLIQLEGVIAESSGRTGEKMSSYIAFLTSTDNIYREVSQMFIATNVSNSFRNPILHGHDINYPSLENSTRALILLHLEVAKLANSSPSSN
jgi:hypothetical protein